jgi:hypothetical protein
MVPIVIKKASGEVKKSTLASPTPDAASKVELAAVPLTPLEQYCDELALRKRDKPLDPNDMSKIAGFIGVPTAWGVWEDPDAICQMSNIPCDWGACMHHAGEGAGQACLTFNTPNWPTSYVRRAASPRLAFVICLLHAFKDGVFAPRTPAA